MSHKNAEIICTDSFHGTVFSLIYNKVFFNFRRYSAKTKSSTNSRIDSLCDNLGLNERRYINEEYLIKQFLNEINYNHVEKKLKELKNVTDSFLEKALNNID